MGVAQDAADLGQAAEGVRVLEAPERRIVAFEQAAQVLGGGDLTRVGTGSLNPAVEGCGISPDGLEGDGGAGL